MTNAIALEPHLYEYLKDTYDNSETESGVMVEAMNQTAQLGWFPIHAVVDNNLTYHVLFARKLSPE